MTIAHGLQYLLLMGLVASGDPRPRARHGGRFLPLAALTSIALAGGAGLSAASDLQEPAPPSGRCTAASWARSWPIS